MRQGIIGLVNHEADLEVCGEAQDASTALAEAGRLRPDASIVDISLRDSSGIELIKDFRIRCPEMPILVLSMHDESFYAERVLRAGARGYVTKGEPPEKVIAALREVLAGGVYVSERVASQVLSRLVGARRSTEGAPIDRLSDREFEVFECIGEGTSRGSSNSPAPTTC
jgi:DNA-binding NarL/FixJ family response regulator